jgi:CrcB protein
MSALAVFVGGGLGSLLRYGVGLLAIRQFGAGYPLGTLLANIAGSFLLGLLARLGLEGKVSPATRLGLTTGLCGGFTTYSTFNYEALSLLADGHLAKGGGYLLLTLVLCAVAGAAGMWLGGRLGG